MSIYRWQTCSTKKNPFPNKCAQQTCAWTPQILMSIENHNINFDLLTGLIASIFPDDLLLSAKVLFLFLPFHNAWFLTKTNILSVFIPYFGVKCINFDQSHKENKNVEKCIDKQFEERWSRLLDARMFRLFSLS